MPATLPDRLLQQVTSEWQGNPSPLKYSSTIQKFSRENNAKSVSQSIIFTCADANVCCETLMTSSKTINFSDA